MIFYRFFKQELQRESDKFRRNLLLQEIQKVEQKIVEHLRREKEATQKENRILRMYLEQGQKQKCKYHHCFVLIGFELRGEPYKSLPSHGPGTMSLDLRTLLPFMKV